MTDHHAHAAQHSHEGHALRPHLPDGSSQPAEDGMGGLNAMAVSATLHCLTGCAIGEILGLMIGTATGLATGWTIALSIGLAFLFGYTLSTLPLLRAGLGLGAALSVVLAADTLSIATMEAVDNLVVAVIPGAMNAGLVNGMFWVSMMIALTAAFVAAYPVNRYLLDRGKGHALTHGYHHAATPVTGARRLIPTLTTSTLLAAIVAFMLGGLTVSVAEALDSDSASSSAGHPADWTGWQMPARGAACWVCHETATALPATSSHDLASVGLSAPGPSRGHASETREP